MRKLISILLTVLVVLSALPALATIHTDTDTVTQVQQALNDAGYNCGQADGKAGKKTAAAIRQYQEDRGLEVTGAIDDALLAAMGLLQDGAADAATAEAPADKSQSGQPGVGDTVFFGHYEQDNHASNGAEPIEWIVVDEQDGYVMLLSKYGLDAVPYNDEFVDVTWKTCTLRSWLSDAFLNEAFTAQEQEAIQVAYIDNSASEGYRGFNTSGGDGAMCRIFLLSYNEAWTYFGDDDSRKCVPTDYAIARGAACTSKYEVEGRGTCHWWLRSPGERQSFAFQVHPNGSGCLEYDYVVSAGVDAKDCCVRPALWVDVNAEVFLGEQNAGDGAEPASVEDQTGADASLSELLTKGLWMYDNRNFFMFFPDGTGSLSNMYDTRWQIPPETNTVVVRYSILSNEYTWTFILDRDGDHYILHDADDRLVMTMDAYDPQEYAELSGTWVSADNTAELILYEDGRAVITDSSMNQCEYVWYYRNSRSVHDGLYLYRYTKEVPGSRELDTLTLYAGGQSYDFKKADSSDVSLTEPGGEPSASVLTQPANTEALAGRWLGTITAQDTGEKDEAIVEVMPSGIGEIRVSGNGSTVVFLCGFAEASGILSVSVPTDSTGLDSVSASSSVTGDRMNIDMTLFYTAGGSRKYTIACQKE